VAGFSRPPVGGLDSPNGGPVDREGGHGPRHAVADATQCFPWAAIPCREWASGCLKVQVSPLESRRNLDTLARDDRNRHIAMSFTPNRRRTQPLRGMPHAARRGCMAAAVQDTEGVIRMGLLSGIRTPPTGGEPGRPRRRHHRQRAAASRTYAVRQRVHESRTIYIPANELAATVTEWLAEMGACSPLVEHLAQEVDANNWPAAHSISECLGIEVTIAT
jgi:hypothetical protein